jgi:hypothetical protein
MGNFILIYLLVGIFTNLIWVYKIPTISFKTLVFMTLFNPFILLCLLIGEIIQIFNKIFK